MTSREIQIGLIRALNTACCGVDDVAYRPFVVKLTEGLPRWWRCDLAKLSMRLDEHWGTGYWESEKAPAVPGGLCEACRRRAAWTQVGGTYPGLEDEPPTTYLDSRPVYLCGWCSLDTSSEPRDEHDLEPILKAAGKRSVSWRWRWGSTRCDATR